MDEVILRRLEESPRIASFFRDWCDFELVEADKPNWFALDTGEPFRVVGRDGAGGRFCTVGGTADYAGALLYVSSEGEAGTIAPSLAEGVAMMVALPYWRDCLHFSGGGALKEMQRAQVRCEADLRRQLPGMDTIRRDAYEALGLTAPASPLETLHRAVAESRVKVVGTADGSPCSSLFSRFTVEHNPSWRGQAS